METGHNSNDKSEKFRIEQACTASEAFSKLYYETLDKRRHILLKFYMPNASLAWNGRSVIGEIGIGHFYESLPVSRTVLTSLNAMPVSAVAALGGTSVLVQTAGTISFQEKAPVPFYQAFLLTVEGEKWKIVTDNFRFQ